MATVSKTSSMTGSQVFILMTIGLAVVILGATASPLHRELELDPTDICLFTCDSCYTGETLVRCGNECILLGGEVGPLLRATCQNFEQNNLPIFPVNKKLHT